MGKRHGLRRFRAHALVILLALAVPAVLALTSCAPSIVPAQEDEQAEEFVFVAEGLSANPLHARENSEYLQRVLDTVSRGGGGTVQIPVGVYRFAATSAHSLGDFAVGARDNVKVVGAGQGKTVLKPVGLWSETGRYAHGVDMFAYNGMESGDYLINADFADFTIDGIEAQGSPDGYNASGKGFFFKLFRNCDWERVSVLNTDGTGFGMDFPINCTMVDCVAEGCGKNAGEDDAGASGFGIGTGYSGLESMTIESCESYDNAKFGFFFEHQTRFNARVVALSASGFYVSDCVASGNLYNFGGARAHDVTYERCVSKVADDPEREAYTRRAFCFENHSYRTKVVDCRVDQRYADVFPTDACFKATEWALDEGLLESSHDDAGVMYFHPYEKMLRSEAAVLLWRYAGRPGDMVFDGLPDMPDDYVDVTETDYFIDAALWMHSLGDASLVEFRGRDAVKRSELVTMIWRMAGKPQVSNVSGFADVDRDSYYEPALAWAVKQGFVSTDEPSFGPNEACDRGEALAMLYAFDQSLVDGLVGEVSDLVDSETMAQMHAMLGSELLPRVEYVMAFGEDKESAR